MPTIPSFVDRSDAGLRIPCLSCLVVCLTLTFRARRRAEFWTYRLKQSKLNKYIYLIYHNSSLLMANRCPKQYCTLCEFSILLFPTFSGIPCAFSELDPVRRLSKGIQYAWKWCSTYRVTVVVRYYVLLTLLLKIRHLDPLLCHLCPFLTSPSRSGQKKEHLKQSQQNLVSDHHGHPVHSV